MRWKLQVIGIDFTDQAAFRIGLKGIAIFNDAQVLSVGKGNVRRAADLERDPFSVGKRAFKKDLSIADLLDLDKGFSGAHEIDLIDFSLIGGSRGGSRIARGLSIVNRGRLVGRSAAGDCFC